jgi:predicted transcriptional regulator
MYKKHGIIFALVFIFSIFFISVNLAALSPEQEVISLQLLDGNDNPKSIPFIGTKVITLIYTDPDVKDVNDPLSNAIKAKKYPKEKYLGMGVANCKDTWIPNAAIRKAVRDKEAQFPGSVILLDDKHALSKTWDLGDCNGAGVVIIIGMDKKVKYVKKILSKKESTEAVPEVLRILDIETGR